METIEVDGKKIRVYRQGTGRPLLYLHSGAGEVGPIAFFAELERAGFAVTVPELPGFGQSDPAPDWHRIEDAVFFLRRTLDVLGIERPILAGSSLGGWLAAELAVWFPDRFEALVLMDPCGLWIEKAPIYDPFGGPGWDEEEAMRRAAPPGFNMIEEVFKPVLGDAVDQESIMLHMMRGTQVIARLGWDPYLHDPNLLGRLGSITAPTLVVWGADDGIVPVAHGDAYAAAIPNARLEVLPKSGHTPALVHPKKVAGLVAEFVGVGLQPTR